MNIKITIGKFFDPKSAMVFVEVIIGRIFKALQIEWKFSGE